MHAESDLLPLSGLQHLAYCERQWALIHLEQFWSENRLTARGRILHERVDQVGAQSRKGVRVVRGLAIHSLRLGLIGRADVVEFYRSGPTHGLVSVDGREATERRGDVATKGKQQFVASSNPGVSRGLKPAARDAGEVGRPFPVEYKHGKAKKDDCDRVQLCAQALCLEEMLGVAVPAGALFYGKTRRRTEVAFDERLRSETERLAVRMHELFRLGETPRVPYDKKRCDACSLIGTCMPKTTGAARNVEAYLREVLPT